MLASTRARLSILSGHLLDFLFVPRCAACRKEGAYLCPTCLAQATPLPEPYFPDNAGGPNACLVSSIYLNGVLACFAMEGAVREAVHQLKYEGVRAIAPMMGASLVERAVRSRRSFDAVVPVPLHKKRLRQRGYNQSALLAKHVADGLRLPLLPALERTVYGPPQARSRAMGERRSAVQGAFAATQRLEGRRILLVDDVCTTGATMDACAQPLMLAGATTVWGLAFAREV